MVTPQYSTIIAADADESIAIDDTARTLTKSTYFTSTGVNAGRAIVQVRTAPILFTLNGTAPLAADESTGQKLTVGSLLILSTLAEIANLKMIRATGTSGAVFVRYEKRIN